MNDLPPYRHGGARALVLLHDREKDLTEAASERPEYRSRWGPRYCIDAMLEHAVMHPLRHRFQLETLLAGG